MWRSKSAKKGTAAPIFLYASWSEEGLPSKRFHCAVTKIFTGKGCLGFSWLTELASLNRHSSKSREGAWLGGRRKMLRALWSARQALQPWFVDSSFCSFSCYPLRLRDKLCLRHLPSNFVPMRRTHGGPIVPWTRSNRNFLKRGKRRSRMETSRELSARFARCLL